MSLRFDPNTLCVQAITTRFIIPTNHRGSRIVARASAGRVTVPYNHALSVLDNHAKAACALADRFGWSGDVASGWDVNGHAVFVFTSRA